MVRIIFLSFAILSVGCGGTSQTSETNAVVYKGSRWPNPAAIPVCWENPAQVSQEIKDDLKAKVIAEYHGKTAIRFTRFDNCGGNDYSATMIRVHFFRTHNWDISNGIRYGGGLSSIGPNPAQLGGNGGRGTLRIDIGSRGQYPAKSNSQRQAVINFTRGIAVHEFGHAVGLAHEHTRSDAPICNDQKRGSAGSNWVYVGAYDPTSIMNYCKRNNIDSLSPGDVAGINFLYPKGTGTMQDPNAVKISLVAKHSDKCVDIESSSQANGAKVQQYKCNQTAAQLFIPTRAADGTYTLKNVNSGKCLDVNGAATSDGAAVIQQDCHGGNNQKIRLREAVTGSFLVQFVHSDKCLDVTEVSLEDGAKLQQWSCNADGLNQNFLFPKAQ